MLTPTVTLQKFRITLRVFEAVNMSKKVSCSMGLDESVLVWNLYQTFNNVSRSNLNMAVKTIVSAARLLQCLNNWLLVVPDWIPPQKKYLHDLDTC